MSEVIRDFSLESIEDIRRLIKENVDEEDQFFLWDWIDDTFTMRDLDINEYINDVSTYQAHMIDKHDISSKKFDTILERVHAVDINYANRFNSIYECMLSYNDKIIKVVNMISPEAIILSSEEYDKVIDNVEQIHTREVNNLDYDLKSLEDSLPELRDIPWYEKALNAVGGVAVSFVRDNIEGICYIPYAIIDDIFGTNVNRDLSNLLDQGEEYLIDTLVSDKVSYYYGKAAGDVICTVEGVVLGAKGLVTIAGGIVFTAGGAALTATGPGALVGAPVMVVSGTAVLAGTTELAFAGGIMYSSLNNMGDNISKAESNKKPDLDDIDLKKNANDLDEGIKEPKRIYKPSPKHNPASAWGSPDPIPDLKTGQKLLETAYSSSKNKQLYNLYDGKIIKFQPDTVEGWHAYVVNNPAKEVPTDVLRQFLNDGKITKAQYKNFLKNN